VRLAAAALELVPRWGLREDVAMASRLESVVVDAADPEALARWWAEALGWARTIPGRGEVAVEPPDPDGLGVPLVFVPVADAKAGKNRLHLDLASGSVDHQTARVARLVGLGAHRVDIGQGDVPWVVLADPEGNELCVLDPRPEYTATGAVAALVVDTADPAALAGFWSQAIGWPPAGSGELWSSLRSASGQGPYLEFVKVADPKRAKNRLHLDLAPAPGSGQAAEVARLRALGATPADVGQGQVSWVVLADPEGNEFCVLTPR
jgi:Glyoxalase-like domain